MLEVRGLAKAFRTGHAAAVEAVADVSFVAEPGQVFTLLGPSGCGKSTTLRMIAGLERPDRGEIAIAGRKVFADGVVAVPAQRRNVGMVFQSYAIWPHMSVYENAAFPLKARRRELGLDRGAIKRRVEAVLAAVSLDGLEGRAATQLSGGQQQRLALARAIVTEPPVILLDEPLSNLDANLRERMRGELRRMQRDLGVAMVYVTHDQAEALALSHRIAVMEAGRIVQVGAPEDIYLRPADAFVATFVGKTNFVAGEVVAAADGRVTVETALGRVVVEGNARAVGDRVRIAIRPEDIELGDAVPGLPHGVVTSTAYYGAFREYGVEAAGQALTLVAGGERTYAAGETVGLALRAGRAVLVG